RDLGDEMRLARIRDVHDARPVRRGHVADVGIPAFHHDLAAARQVQLPDPTESAYPLAAIAHRTGPLRPPGPTRRGAYREPRRPPDRARGTHPSRPRGRTSGESSPSPGARSEERRVGKEWRWGG